MFLLASLKAEEGASTGGLRGIQVMAPGPWQARVVDLGDEGVLREGFSQDGAVACLSLHAQRHGLEAAQAQPAVKGTQDGALSILQKLDWFRIPDWFKFQTGSEHQTGFGALVPRTPWENMCELWQCATSVLPYVVECVQAPGKENQRAAPYSA